MYITISLLIFYLIGRDFISEKARLGVKVFMVLIGAYEISRLIYNLFVK